MLMVGDNMTVIVDLTPTNINFMYNGQIYVILEIMQDGNKKLIITAEVAPAVEEDKLLEENI
jgi:hypothetical protein